MKIFLEQSKTSSGIWAGYIGAMVTIALLVSSVAFSQPYSNPAPVPLLTAGTYGALAFSGISGSANVNGDVGTTGSTIDVTIVPSGTNWGVGGVHNGQAQTDLTAALVDANGRSNDATIAADALGGLTLGCGVYSGGDLDIASNTTLTLNGTATDVFIFKAASTVTANINSTVALTGGAVWSNVFWYVGSSATIFSGSTFNGIILAQVSITVNASAALVTAKLLASTGAVTINSNVLPVELVSFTASADNMNANLRWLTATEVNNFGFDVEKSRILNTEDGSQESDIRWEKIGFVEGHGTTNAPKSYTFTDGSAGGTVAYRLKQIDRDGKFSYSGSVEVTIGNTLTEFALMQNYPNPFNPTTVINYQIPSAGHVSLKVFDILGNEAAILVNGMKEAGRYTAEFDGTKLSSGIYFYTINAGNMSATKKLILMK